MNTKSRITGGLALSVAMFGTMIALAPAAQANTSSCNNIGNGQLCVNIINGEDYQASYTKWGGNQVVVDFNLFCANGDWFGDDGAFSIQAGETRTYIFAIGDHGSCQVRMTNLANGDEYWTGYVYP